MLSLTTAHFAMPSTRSWRGSAWAASGINRSTAAAARRENVIDGHPSVRLLGPAGGRACEEYGIDGRSARASSGMATIRWAHAVLLAGLAAGLGAMPASALTVLNRGNGSEIKSLDPHFIDGINESTIEGDILVGLTTMDAAGEPIAGAAARWTVSPDGLTWTFHLRDHLWSDGRPVTAADFVFAWRRLLDPRTGASYAYNLWVVKNAHAISTGKLPPAALGARAVDDQTLVVTLEHPAALSAAAPDPRHDLSAAAPCRPRPGAMAGPGPAVSSATARSSRANGFRTTMSRW